MTCSLCQPGQLICGYCPDSETKTVVITMNAAAWEAVKPMVRNVVGWDGFEEIDSDGEHTVLFEETRFTVEHPLEERLEGSLMDCELHRALSQSVEPPEELGRYRVHWDGTNYTILPREQ